MMLLDFPNAPIMGQTWDGTNGAIYTYDGVKWTLGEPGGTYPTYFNVVDFGADPTGVQDSAPAFRACMGSDRRVLVPPGTYLFNSTVPLPAPYYTFAFPGCLASGFTNFTIEGYGATIIFGTAATTGGQQANQMAAFMFDRCTEFVVEGLTLQMNITGLGTPVANKPNVGMAFASCTDFTVQDVHVTGYVVYAFDGDWLVNGLFRRIVIDSAIMGFDMAYLYRCVWDNCRIVGSDLTGTGAAHSGNLGFSCIVDPSNSTYNFTAIPTASFTAHNTWRNNSVTNCASGWYATTGRYYTLQGNRWFNNPGQSSTSTPAVGVLLGYDATNGVGVPISNVIISGDEFSGNGAGVSGWGLLLVNPSGSDFLSDVTITGCIFDNNTAIGIGANGGTTNIRRVQSIGNTFTGANQTTDIVAGLIPDFGTILGGSLTNQKIGDMATVSMLNNGHMAFKDTSGASAYWTVQPDNNMIWYGTNSSGGSRALMAIAQHQDASQLTIFPITNFNSAVTFSGAVNAGTVAITGGTINGATIGASTPSTGSFTNLAASGTVSGAGFTTLLSPYALSSSVPIASSTTPIMDGTAAVGAGTTWARADHVHPSDTSRLATAGGTVTGDTTFNGALNNTGGNLNVGWNGSGGPAININGGNGTWRALTYETGGLARWILSVTGTSEPGSGNVGSDFAIISRADDGVTGLGTPILITRSTGLVTIGGGLVAGASITAAAAGGFVVGSTKVVGAQITGYGTPTGPVKLINFPGASATLAQTSAMVAQLIVDLKTHGLLGA